MHPEPETLQVTVNGKLLRIAPGVSVAVAVLQASAEPFRRSASGEPRDPLCGMGVCFECRVTIDDAPHRRSCQIPCRDGMVVVTG